MSFGASHWTMQSNVRGLKALLETRIIEIHKKTVSLDFCSARSLEKIYCKKLVLFSDVKTAQGEFMSLVPKQVKT